MHQLKLFKEIVYQISTPFAIFLNLSHKEGIVPPEWKQLSKYDTIIFI